MVWFQTRKPVAFCSGHSHHHHPRQENRTSAAFLNPQKNCCREDGSASLQDMKKAFTHFGQCPHWRWHKCSGSAGTAWSGPREWEAQEAQTLPGWESFTAVTTSHEWHPNELSSSSFSEHYNTNLTGPSQQSRRCIKTLLDHRRCFTLRSLFPAAEYSSLKVRVRPARNCSPLVTFLFSLEAA